MDLRSYGRTLTRRWRVMLTVFLLLGATLVGASFLIPATYKANVRIVFAPNLSSDTPMETRQIADLYVTSRMKTYAQLVTTNQVLQPVIDSLNLNTAVPDLVQQTVVTIPAGTTVIDLEVTASTARLAAATANRIANQMPWAVSDLERTPTVAESPIQVTVLQPADVPQHQSSPKMLLTFIVAIGLAFLVAVFAAVIVDNFDTRVRSRRDVTALGVPFLGGIPTVPKAKAKDLVQFTQLAPGLKAILHRIAIDVLYAADETTPTLIVTSPRVNVGKTMVAANIAGALAEAGNHVVFIDADVRGGRLAAQVGIPQTRGITDLASGRTNLDESLFQWKWDGFTVIPCGATPIDVGEMLAGERFGELVRELSGYFDVIIVDAPPITNLSEASLFTRTISNVVIVAGAANTRRVELRRAANSLRQAGAKVLGVVLTRTRKNEESAPADENGRNDEEMSDR
ncbi:polysaccharide biosynthesis tyrosine autokinase [Mycolicibacterium sphagni]|uniref:Polysaccharide biosynthesis tyrosine autokinase n=1 Tax=Mycolicibacterium sphagni TaxID=1786 RepID=A0ABX2JWU1_9MYCO|nr:polysaccharide biosynthesis tyrosine autokinase [Mycolicibacterium sphagni]NTY61053.1 polysaccharide biosynthesis tyrosine autokinase [Mycolicibacterium sphagni]